jgi:hypothetical protein
MMKSVSKSHETSYPFRPQHIFSLTVPNDSNKDGCELYTTADCVIEAVHTATFSMSITDQLHTVLFVGSTAHSCTQISHTRKTSHHLTARHKAVSHMHTT